MSIQDFYYKFANFFAKIVRPDGGSLSYYDDTDTFTEVVFTHFLVIGVLLISCLTLVIYYFLFNGKNAPANRNSAKDWFAFFGYSSTAMTIVTALLFWLDAEYPINSTHFICTSVANILFSIPVYFLVSLLIKRWSTSASKVPF